MRLCKSEPGVKLIGVRQDAVFRIVAWYTTDVVPGLPATIKLASNFGYEQLYMNSFYQGLASGDRRSSARNAGI